MTGLANTVIVITNGDPTSLTDAYAFIKITHMARPKTDIRVVVNMAKDKKEGQAIYNKLLKACEGFLKISPPLLGVIRSDTRVSECIRNQTPLLMRHPNCDAAHDIEAIAQTTASHIARPFCRRTGFGWHQRPRRPGGHTGTGHSNRHQRHAAKSRGGHCKITSGNPASGKGPIAIGKPVDPCDCTGAGHG